MQLEGNQQAVEVEGSDDPLAEYQAAPGDQEGSEGADGEQDNQNPTLPNKDVTLDEQILKHPIYTELQSKTDKLVNITKTLTHQWEQANEQLKNYRKQEINTLVERLGDNPDSQQIAQLLSNLHEREAKVALDETRLAPIAKAEKCNDVMAEYGIPVEYRSEIMAAPNLLAMETVAKTLKSLLPKLSKVNPTKKPPVPALEHIPDKGQGSVPASSVDQVQEAYLSGKIDYKVYAKKMMALGKSP